jgi:hypothetical protein
MQDITTFLNSGWDFVDEVLNGTSDYWQVSSGGYPLLRYLSGGSPTMPEGRGTAEQPYLIRDARDLGTVWFDPLAHYRLEASVDLSGITWSTPVIPWFGGTFDGNGHVIYGANKVLFEQLCSTASVFKLGLETVEAGGGGGILAGINYGDVSACYSRGGSGALVVYNHGRVSGCHRSGSVFGGGGLVHLNTGTVTASYSTGTVSGWEDVGGLVGVNSGSVTRCFSTGVVTGTRSVGGLVGSNVWYRGASVACGEVVDCYSTASVAGSERVGGLVGDNSLTSSIVRSYSRGAISGTSHVGGFVGYAEGSWATTEACFWDIETSGQTTSVGGTGKTTGEMQTASTFLAAGWNFVDERANGMEDVWWILESQDYPRLSWEGPWAYSPDPRNGEFDVVRNHPLTWLPAKGTLAHDVYFGEDEDTVVNATPESLGIYHGRQPVGIDTYDPGPLEWGTTYYWRIDEVNEADPNSPWKGNVWRFSTAEFLVVTVVDDFESYTDDTKAGQAIFQTWHDKLGYMSDPNDPNDQPSFPGNGTGALVGYMISPFAEQVIVHAGKQSMPMEYDNASEPWLSEADRTWPTMQDWTTDGADTLTLYFRGELSNASEQLYVGIEDSAGRIAVAVHPDAEAALATEWKKWHIALGEVQAAGVDVAAVKKMLIGVGDRQNPKPGGTGTIYIDDIRLTKRMP